MLYGHDFTQTKRRLADCRRRRASLHYGTLWRVLVKTAAFCLLTALLVFVYAEGAAKWWGAPFMLAFAAIAVALPCACAYYTRAIARLEEDLRRLSEGGAQSDLRRKLSLPAASAAASPKNALKR